MKQYYITKPDGQNQGPLDEGFVREQYAAGAYEDGTTVWTDGMSDLTPISSVFPELKPRAVPVPPMSPPQKQYYVIGADGQQQGPLDEDFVRGQYEARAFGHDTHVWTDGMPAWMSIASVFPSENPATPPPPPSFPVKTAVSLVASHTQENISPRKSWSEETAIQPEPKPTPSPTFQPTSKDTPCSNCGGTLVVKDNGAVFSSCRVKYVREGGKTYKGQAVFSLIVSLFFAFLIFPLIFSLIALIQSLKASRLWEKDDPEYGQAAASANTWSRVSLISSAILLLLFLILIVSSSQ